MTEPIGGLHAYHYSIKLAKLDAPFYALIMAAMRKADTDNLTALQRAFPVLWAELQDRYNAPLGAIPQDGIIDIETLTQNLREFEKKGL